jgi:hypothetical protein
VIVSFVIVCAVTAFVCTAVKEDEGPGLPLASLRLLKTLGGGILAFAAAIQFFTWLAG